MSQPDPEPIRQLTSMEILSVDTITALLPMLDLSGAATLPAIFAEVRRRNSGWRNEEIVDALRTLEHCGVLASRSDEHGRLSILIPGAAWPRRQSGDDR